MQLLSFFAATYGVTWSGIAMVVALHGWDLSAIGSVGTAAVVIAMVLGPSIGGVVLTFAYEGREGLRDLRHRWVRWRIGIQWYAVALLTVPMLLLPMLLALSWFLDPVYAPRFQPVLLLAGIVIGAFEETGWTGFATPRLLQGYSVGVVGFGLGVVWTIWHVFADYVGNATSFGADWLIVFAVFWIAPLPAYRVLMTWVYSRTNSVLISALMHGGYTGWLLAFAPTMPVRDGLIWQGLFAFTLWLVVFGVWASGELGKRSIDGGAQ
jgi:membrane protease YdiL (CAAX protease family)